MNITPLQRCAVLATLPAFLISCQKTPIAAKALPNVF